MKSITRTFAAIGRTPPARRARDGERWPIAIRQSPEALAVARVCERCEHLGHCAAGEPICTKLPGENPARLRDVIRRAACPEGRHDDV